MAGSVTVAILRPNIRVEFPDYTGKDLAFLHEVEVPLNSVLGANGLDPTVFMLLRPLSRDGLLLLWFRNDWYRIRALSMDGQFTVDARPFDTSNLNMMVYQPTLPHEPQNARVRLLKSPQ